MSECTGLYVPTFCMMEKENEEMNAFVGLMVACKTVVVIGICGNLTL